MGTNFVYSTLTCDNTYTNYVPNSANDLPVIESRVLIKGGANLATKLFGTPAGVMTQVSDDDLAILETNEVFKMHVDKGFITVRSSQVDVERAASEMEAKDEAAPLVPQDFPTDGDKDSSAKPSAKNMGGKLKSAVL